MTSVTLSREIKSALQNNIVSQAEVKKFEKATGASVSNAEGKRLGDLYNQLTGPQPMWLQPGDQPRFGAGAGEKLGAFFVKSRMPYGPGEALIRPKVEAALDQDWGAPLQTKPKTTSLHPLYIPAPPNSADFPARTAWYDAVKEQVFLQVSGGFAAHIEQWYGPVSVKGAGQKPQQPSISHAALDRARDTYLHFQTVALFDWDACPTSMPLGARTVEAEFQRERRPNGYGFSAVFQIGALAPGAPTSSPDDATSVWIKRSGPDGDRFLGPIPMDAVTG